jgi:hypothetical protein
MNANKIVGFIPSGGNRKDWLLYALPKLDTLFSKIPNFTIYIFNQNDPIPNFSIFKFIQQPQEHIGIYARKQKYANLLLNIDPTITHILSMDDDILINSFSQNLLDNFIKAFNLILSGTADAVHLNKYYNFHARPFDQHDLEIQTITYQLKAIIFPITLYTNNYPWPQSETDNIFAGEDNFTFILCLYNNYKLFIAFGFEDFLHLSKNTPTRKFNPHFPQSSGLLHNSPQQDYDHNMTSQNKSAPCIFPAFFLRPYTQIHLLHPKILYIINAIKNNSLPYNKFYTGIPISSIYASSELKPASNILITYSNSTSPTAGKALGPTTNPSL